MLVEQSNRTVEDCIKKLMVSQEDWEPMLPSVLFALRVSKHSSTGMAPYRVLYQRDPILPLQYMDRVNNGGLDNANDCLNNDYNDSDDPVCDLVERLEKIRNNCFVQASDNIQKAQKHQAKNYNARHKGTSFKVGEEVLKKNMRDAGCKAKMCNKYTGPYQITNITSSGLYYLKDKYSHQLKRPVPPNHLGKYHGVGGFAKSDVNVEDCEYDSSEIEAGVSYKSNDYRNVQQSIFSDKSVIEVVSEKNYSSHNDSDDVDCNDIHNKNNPWGDMDVQEIPLDIKHEDLDVMSDNTSINSSSSSSSSSGSPIITGVEKGPDVIFSPLSNIDHLNAAKKFHIKLQPSDHIVSHRGIGFVLNINLQ